MDGGDASSHHDESMYSVDSWVKMWNDGQWGFHCKKVNDLLIKYYEKLSLQTRQDQRIFIPLCGKSLDMKWLADKGHQVVGVDCAARAAVDFFAENDTEYITSQVTGIDSCTLYKSEDKRIQFYVCDFFALTEEHISKFDVIWDRGSLNAMPMSKSEEYVKHISQFMKSGTRVLLDLFECYDEKGELIKSMSRSEKDVQRLYGNCSCEVLGTYAYSDIEKDMSMDSEQEETFKRQVEEESRNKGAAGEGSTAEEGGEGHGHDLYKNMIGKTYLLVVK